MDEQNTTPPTEPQPVELVVVRFADVPNCELHIPKGSTMQQVGHILAGMIYGHATMGWNERDQYAQMAQDLKDEREAMQDLSAKEDYPFDTRDELEADPSHD